MTKRLAITLASIIVTLMIACTVVVVITFNNVTAAEKEADYRACMADRGVYETTNIDDMADMSDSCWSAVYGD